MTASLIREKVLLVDDDVRVLQSFARNLQLSGYAVLTAADGVEAVSLYRQELPSLALVDVRMPDMDGFAVLRAILDLNPQAQVILMTGHGDDKETVLAALRHGAADFVLKPIDQETLATLLARAHARLQDQFAPRPAYYAEDELWRYAQVVQAQAVYALAQVVGGIAHDLQQPLASTSLEADCLKIVADRAQAEGVPYEDLLAVGELAEIGEALRENVVRCQDTVAHLRAFIEPGGSDAGPLILAQPLDDCLALVATRLRDHNVTLRVQQQPDLPLIVAEAAQLKQVFLNLIVCVERAFVRREAAGEVFEKTLDVVVEAADAEVVAWLRCNGRGPSPDALARLDTPLALARDADTALMGLYLARAAVRQLGGDLVIDARPEGPGLSFAVRFPEG